MTIKIKHFAELFEPLFGWIVVYRTEDGTYARFDEYSFASTRSAAIKKYAAHYKSGEGKYFSVYGDRGRRPRYYDTWERLWRAERRTGLVKCIKVEVIPRMPCKYNSDEELILADVGRRLHDQLRCSEAGVEAIGLVKDALRDFSVALGRAFGIDPIGEMMDDVSEGG